MTVSRIKVRLPTKFPSTVTVEPPIALGREGGGYQFSLDTSPFMTDFLESSTSAEALEALGYPGSSFGDPIVILCMGQSNFVQRPAYSWTPASNVVSWNWDDVDGTVGTAFVAVPGSTINMPESIGSAIADLYPGRTVYVIGIAIGSQSIAHWMTGTSAPDMYENTVDNVVPALASIGATKIDEVYWWQGENATATPETYAADFTTVMNRFRALSWFPASTPITIFSLAPTTISGSIYTDKQNEMLQQVVRDEPDLRRFVYTGQLPASAWADTLHPSGVGMFDMGRMGAEARHKGDPHTPTLNPISHLQNNGSLGRPAYRNLIRGGDFTTNPWVNGTSFVSAADATQFLTNFFWVQSGAGVVDILKTADAPTVAQAGQFTQHCIHVDVTTADAAIGGTDYYGIRAHITGFDSSFLGFGQTGAKNVVVSFWVKATVTGNYFVAIENTAQNRSYNTQYTVNAADTWEKKHVVIPGDVTGTWLYTGAGSLRVFFTIASSDTYLFTPDVWNAADVRVGNATRANGMSSTSNNFKLALVQVEEGLFPSAFDRIPDLPASSITNISAATAAFLVTPSSANLRSAVSDESGSGALLFAGGNIGAATGTSLAATGALSSSGTAGVGYATGAGGTVTQATSKSTGVTLDKITGQITMNNASLASNTLVSFTLTNSTIAATDMVVLNIASGSVALAAYTIFSTPAAGSATITLRNNSGGALAEALVVQFAVIKAVTA